MERQDGLLRLRYHRDRPNGVGHRRGAGESACRLDFLEVREAGESACRFGYGGSPGIRWEAPELERPQGRLELPGWPMLQEQPERAPQPKPERAPEPKPELPRPEGSVRALPLPPARTRVLVPPLLEVQPPGVPQQPEVRPPAVPQRPVGLGEPVARPDGSVLPV